MQGPGILAGPFSPSQIGICRPWVTGSGNSTGFPRQHRSGKTPFHPENGCCLGGVCSPFNRIPSRTGPNCRWNPLPTFPAIQASAQRSLAMISSGRYRFLDIPTTSFNRSEKHYHDLDRFEGGRSIWPSLWSYSTLKTDDSPRLEPDLIDNYSW